jgi:hypothetical protein
MSAISLYSDDLAAEIVARIAEGRTITDISESEGMPSRRTITRWMAENETFGAQCARARIAQADVLADKIKRVCDEVLRDEIRPDNARVALNSLQWLAMKANPQAYGDKIGVQHSGEQTINIRVGGVPVPVDADSQS